MSNDINKLKQRLEIRKYLVFAGMFLLFLGAMWLIYNPQNEMFRLLGTKRSFSQNETFFFSHP